MADAEDWARRVQAAANENADFAAAARWLDLKLVLRFGAAPFWFKIYRGRIIDAAPYSPVTNMLGYDVVVTGAPAAWRRAIDGTSTYGRETTTGQIAGDGNRVEVERSLKAMYVLGAEVIAQCGLPPGVEG
jgi:hypothetical protein